jgi:hypothetical protein
MLSHLAQLLELDVAGVGELHAERIKKRVLAVTFVIGTTVSSPGLLAYILAGVEYDALSRARVLGGSVVAVDTAP